MKDFLPSLPHRDNLIHHPDSDDCSAPVPSVTRHPAICPYDCPAACGLLITIKDGKAVKVEGDPSHPIYHGLICEKMRHYERAIYSSDRLLRPLKRVGAKGSGEFAPVSWEDAVKDITDHWKAILAEHGPDAVVGFASSGTQGLIQKNCVDAFFHKMGGRLTEKTLCSGAKGAAYKSCMGSSGALCPSELPACDYYLVWGSNQRATMIHTLAILQEQRKLGKKITLIEVCAEDMNPYCDETILIRPGSDGALALAMMHVLVKEGYVPEDFIREFASGYEEFAKTLPSYTPEWASQICQIPAETIINLAREFGRAKAPAVLQGTGLSRRKNGGMNTRLIMTLSMLTGTWGKGGGYVGRGPKPGTTVDLKRVSRPDFLTHPAKKENLAMLADVLVDPTVKTVFISGGNPVNSIHDQQKVIAGLSREDIFTVVHERIMTDTAKYADYILPATYSLEHTDCYNSAGYCTFGTSWQLLDPPGECLCNWDTMALLAQAMGYEDSYFKKSDRDMLTELLQHPGSALQKVPEKERNLLWTGGAVKLPCADHQHFPTPDGKFRIIDDSLETPIPCYQPDFEDPYPLCLVAVPNPHTLNSVFFDREDQLEKRGPAKAWIHPEEAAKRNISTGDLILLKNDLGQVELTASVTELVARGCIAVSGTYSQAQSGHKLQINALHHVRSSDIGGGTTLNGNHVDMIPRGRG